MIRLDAVYEFGAPDWLPNISSIFSTAYDQLRNPQE